MKLQKFLFAVLVAGLVVFGGCGKSDQALPTTPPLPVINAVPFRPAFASATPEIKAIADQVMMSIQGSAYSDALKGLGKLGSNSNLTDDQKKIIKDLVEQVRNKMAAMAPK